ncbi:MAG: hypothetical protein Q9171_002394 [Xanthocarpia ochracea]
MTKHAFHLTRHASSHLYQFVSSPNLRLIQFCLTLVAIFFFSIGVGLAKKYVKPYSYWDLGTKNDFCEKVALGFMFVPFPWLAFLLVWHVLKKPKIHPGYYIGFDLYLGLSVLAAMLVLFNFSAYVLGTPSSVCDGWRYRKDPNLPALERCIRHAPAIRGIYCTAYVFAWIVGLMHVMFFGVACRVCDVYDREKKANNRLEKTGVILRSQSRSSSREHIV